MHEGKIHESKRGRKRQYEVSGAYRQSTPTRTQREDQREERADNKADRDPSGRDARTDSPKGVNGGEADRHEKLHRIEHQRTTRDLNPFKEGVRKIGRSRG